MTDSSAPRGWRRRPGPTGVAAGLAAVALAAAGLSVVSASADDPAVTTYEVSASATSVAVGDTVEVTVAARDVEDLYAYDVNLAYDPEALAYEEDSASTSLGGQTFASAAGGALHVVHTPLGSESAAKGDVTLTTARFTALRAGPAEVRARDLTTVSPDQESATTASLGIAAVTVDPLVAPAADGEPTLEGRRQVGFVIAPSEVTWNLADVASSYQWFRGGEPIAEATEGTYRLQPVDAGQPISVRVTGTKANHVDGVTTSEVTAPVAAAPTRTAIKVTPKRLRSGRSVTVRVAVRSHGVTPAGRITVMYRGRAIRDVAVDAHGNATVKFPMKAKGTRKVRVHYRPATGFQASSSRFAKVRVR